MLKEKCGLFEDAYKIRPLVTVVLPVYNGADTLKLAINSIIQQTFENWEMIIIDDCSVDHSLDVIREFNDSRIRLICGDNNIGLSARLNMSVNIAKGKYLARMDQDDISYPERIQLQVDYLEKNQYVDLLATQILLFKDEGEVLGKLQVQERHFNICENAWRGFAMPHPTWMGKLEWFRLYQYESEADGVEDQQLLYRSYPDSCFACLNEVLLGYRVYPRKFRSLLAKRRLFAVHYGKISVERKNYVDAFKAVMLQFFKVVFDVIFALKGGKEKPLNLCQPSQRGLKKWHMLWNDILGN